MLAERFSTSLKLYIRVIKELKKNWKRITLTENEFVIYCSEKMLFDRRQCSVMISYQQYPVPIQLGVKQSKLKQGVFEAYILRWGTS